MTRANLGCGSVRPYDWVNFDVFQDKSDPEYLNWDLRRPCPYKAYVGRTDYAVCSFVIQEFDHHELPGVLSNIRSILKPGGRLRVMVPDIFAAINAYRDEQEDWFPQDERTGGLDAKFCTYITWFGTARSVFTFPYLRDLLWAAGFDNVQFCVWGSTYGPREIMELDSRPKEALIVEAKR